MKPGLPQSTKVPLMESLRRPGATAASSEAAALTRRVEITNDDPGGYESAVGQHYSALVRRLVLVLGNEHDAQDVAQDAYLKAFRSWDRFDEPMCALGSTQSPCD